jgi:tRNA A-37 threonylcarbamoyl transferase component Bud32
VRSDIIIAPAYRDMLAAIGLTTVPQVFSDDRLRVWRDLEDRDNSTLDATLPDGRSIRLHVKRDKRKRREPMALEARGITLLNNAGIDSAPLVAHGSLGDRTFVITENLDGYLSADRLMETDVDRRPILLAMSSLAAQLHNAAMHHRDLYANHFYMKPEAHGGYSVRLIDTARVQRLPVLFRERWIVKDVGQLLFSIATYADTSAREAMWTSYLAATKRQSISHFVTRVEAKAAWIDRHDRALRAKKPKRNLRLADGN